MAEEKQKQEITQATAKIGDLHISPRKVRLVTDLIKKKTFTEAVRVLKFLSKKSAHPLLKLLNSAAANARNNFQLEPEHMFVSNITVDTGKVAKRFMPRAQGRAFPINRRTSIVRLTLTVNPKSRAGATKAKPKVKTPPEKFKPADKSSTK